MYKRQELTRDGKISAGHARALLSLNDEEKMVEIADQILKKEISVREVERLAKAAAKEKKQPENHPLRRDTFYDEVELALTNSLGRRIKVNPVSYTHLDVYKRQAPGGYGRPAGNGRSGRTNRRYARTGAVRARTADFSLSLIHISCRLAVS